MAKKRMKSSANGIFGNTPEIDYYKDIDNEDDSLIELPKAATVSSKNIKVFPCAYRGAQDPDTGDRIVFGAESRINTEFNLFHTVKDVYY